MPPNSTDLDLFVLALVQRGCANPYDLKSQAGISVGSSAPVLERLEQSQLIKGSPPGVRKRQQFSITKSGTKTLESGWRDLLASRPTDPDATLRITYLAWALGRQGELMDFIDSSSTNLKNAAATRLAEANQLQGIAGSLGGEAFRWLKASFEAARLEAQSQALKELGKQIKKQAKVK
ncbi:MAG TPA: PadR family transcriptional regulator [Terriglobales bacterium]